MFRKCRRALGAAARLMENSMRVPRYQIATMFRFERILQSRRLSAGGSKVIFARRSRPPRTVTAALFAGTEGLLVLIHAKCFILPDYRITFFPFVKAGSEKNSHEKNVPPPLQ